MSVRFVDDYLLYLLARASTEVSGHFHKQLKQHRLQVSEWRVLATLSDGDGMTLGELADRALQRQPTMSKIIDRMEGSGLVERRQSERDRRRVCVYITNDGRNRVDAALYDAKIHEAEVLSDYGEKEAAVLKSVLKSLIERNGVPVNAD